MMEYIHKRKYIEFGKTVTIEVNIQANVLLMEDDDFNRFRTNRRHNHYGGLTRLTPYRINVPHSGYWNIVIDLDGFDGPVSHSINISRY